ncbi:tRNA (adenosine(37)-N6)-threonylcarbamoyltransferase complex dimerization subunit type 1 TsaB [Motilimonas pumila]|uniref:tRNA threonylcarbamoyladenosine biosynthesis protein TsaB n=1 Tax=Motilimonas pumila TaxID=2303987 RepID=A0A418YD91_9GAMM|nr:tRNA (adenosine(37)-N6)-threonylcarbamoyltransferase complex dimerization subunit type 1 TsaB [Motilimonas pumila]RJG42515.1 tRNA (adenosine(37)-N6)-threonylcarbamoyltransferase complex dimerization subunit type 1 TsaB [Motilimonas pumila]
MTKFLAVDTSTEGCSVAVESADKRYANFQFSPREHTQRILPMVDEVLASAKLTLSDCDALVYGQGPGSFTGVRIGIGIAQGLAFGAELPMIGVSTLQAMAQQAREQQGATSVLAAIDARMGEVYFGHYQDHGDGIMTLVGQEHVLTPEGVCEMYANLAPAMTAVGTGWQAYPALLDHFAITEDVVVEFPAAEFMLPFAKNCWQRGETVSADKAQAIYLRDKVTWKKLPGRE